MVPFTDDRNRPHVQADFLGRFADGSVLCRLALLALSCGELPRQRAFRDAAAYEQDAALMYGNRGDDRWSGWRHISSVSRSKTGAKMASAGMNLVSLESSTQVTVRFSTGSPLSGVPVR